MLTLFFIALTFITAEANKTTPYNKQANTFSCNSTPICIYQASYPFTLPSLPYAYNALEPYIDEKTMRTHHSKHHQGYVNNLNNTLKNHPELHKKSLFDLLAQLDDLPSSIRNSIRNNGGGHLNHTLFWTMMKPNSTQKKPKNNLAKKIDTTFGSFKNFQEQFNKTAKSVFGSGWAWLVSDQKGNLSIIATHNQDSPASEQQKPILGLDVWEHAYYLKYQNRRGDYITAWWQVINWPEVEILYKKAIS